MMAAVSFSQNTNRVVTSCNKTIVRMESVLLREKIKGHYFVDLVYRRVFSEVTRDKGGTTVKTSH